MNKEEEKRKSESCCDDPPCCSPKEQGGVQSSQNGGRRRDLIAMMKTSIFVAIVLAAVVVASISVINKTKAGSTVQTGDVGDATTPCEEPCDRMLSSFKSLDKLASDKDFVFILLPGGNPEGNVRVANLVEKASKTISKKGPRTGTFTMKAESPDYEKVVSSFEIKSLPAVLAMGKGCGANIVAGEITEETLLAGYLLASKPVSGGCCPK